MTPFHELVYLGLSFIDVDDASNLYDAQFHSWLDAHAGRTAWAPLVEDASVIASLYRARLPRSRWLHALPFLHESVEDFLESATLSIDQLGPDHVRNADLLLALQSDEPSLIEIVRADLALVAKQLITLYRDPIASRVEEARPTLQLWLDRARAIDDSFDPSKVEICHSLGAHGRALGDWILVGIPASWNSLDFATSAVQALHEHSVIVERRRLSDSLDDASAHEQSETAALRRLDQHIAHAHPDLRAAHARWRARYVEG